MLSLAGASAYVFSWKIGIAVALVMLTVVASYRQNVHAYPSGGGDYEVATVNLGRRAGVTVASALLGRLRAHRGGVDLVRGAERRLGHPRAVGPRGAVRSRAGGGAGGHEPARRARVRGVLRDPDLCLHGRHHRDVRCAALVRWLHGTLPKVESAQYHIIPQHGYAEPLGHGRAGRSCSRERSPPAARR